MDRYGRLRLELDPVLQKAAQAHAHGRDRAYLAELSTSLAPLRVTTELAMGDPATELERSLRINGASE